ncbi:MAG: SIS domain-containing protein [Flavobacteriaceae bacterium]|nr:SIS domain-containing protein [Flavobacteriaceae bacterium]
MDTITLHAEALVKTLVAKAEDGNQIAEVFLVACGGSLVDLYPAKFFLSAESRLLRTELYTANEFVHVLPKVLGKQSVVILCSHTGVTPEVVKAAKVAKEAGSFTVTLTHNTSATIADYSDQHIVYEWGDESSVKNNPMAIALALCLEIFEQSEGYAHYKEFKDALLQIDGVVAAARNKVSERVNVFAEAYQDQRLFYVLSSGASYGHAYGFAICSLMEMQWLNASSIHSGEFFHGPFEVTDEKANFIILMNEGRTRPLDQRVIAFLERYARNYVIVDAKELGIAVLPESVVEFFNPILFYSILCDYREALAEIRNHPLEKRRYMGIVDY